MKLAPFVIVLAARLAAADGIRHVPPSDAEAGSALELVAEAPPTTPTLVAHVRAAGQRAWNAIELVRKDDASWVAVVPAPAVVEPGLEYYLDAGGEPVFASADAPHRLLVRLPDESERKERDEIRSAARRSRIHSMVEFVSFGNHDLHGTQFSDYYYRVDADFSYRLWAYPLEELRVGYTRLIGPAEQMTCDSSAPCDTGFKVGGWFELGLAPIEGIRFDGRMMVMATKGGFGIGGRGEARLGDRDASHVALGVEGIQDTGASGYFRLGWGTVPTVPMSATVEVTDLPATSRPKGVRLFYDIAHDFGQGVRVGIRLGYAARVQQVAGFTSGVGATVDF
jgi:hypothetical protein